MPVKPTRQRSPRGYLLLEVVLGGAIIAVFLTGALVAIGGVQDQSTLGARKTIAASLVSQRMGELISLGFDGVDAGAWANETTTLEDGGTYTRTTAKNCALTTATVPAVDFCRATVTVTFSFKGKPQSRSATVELFDEP